MKKILMLGLLGLLIAVPAVSAAATYYYVDTTGRMVTVEAANSTEALAVAQAGSADPHSGVMLAQGVSVPAQPNTTGFVYNYVDISGMVRSVIAPDAETAFKLAMNIAPKSGVIRTTVVR